MGVFQLTIMSFGSGSERIPQGENHFLKQINKSLIKFSGQAVHYLYGTCEAIKMIIHKIMPLMSKESVNKALITAFIIPLRLDYQSYKHKIVVLGCLEIKLNNYLILSH